MSGYPLTDARITELLAEYVRYRDAAGSIPQPYMDLVSALSELLSLRQHVASEAAR